MNNIYNIGNGLTKDGKFDEAIAKLSEIKKENKDYLDAQLLIVQNYLNKYNESEEDSNSDSLVDEAYKLLSKLLEELKENNNKYKQNKRNILNLMAGINYTNYKNVDEAFTLWNECNEIVPRDPYILYNLSLIYFKTKEYNKTISYLKESLESIKDRRKKKELQVMIHYNSAMVFNELANKLKTVKSQKSYLEKSKEAINESLAVFNEIPTKDMSFYKFFIINLYLLKAKIYSEDEAEFNQNIKESFKIEDPIKVKDKRIVDVYRDNITLILKYYFINNDISSFTTIFEKYKPSTSILSILFEELKIKSDFLESSINNFFIPILEKHDNLFKKSFHTNTEVKYKYSYTKIYLLAIRITCLLEVDVDDRLEPSVAHYTTISTAKHLLFSDESYLRLNTIISANDPKEGFTYLDSLKLEYNKQPELANKIQPFISCFTFNHESLNQFRLYGKENNREATGVSIVVNMSFFLNNVYSYNPLAKYFTDTGDIIAQRNSSKEKDSSDHKTKLPLYRCIYMDPNTAIINSVGQRELYSFFRENKNIDNEAIARRTAKKQSDKILDLEDTLRMKIRELSRYIKGRVNRNKLSMDIIQTLLLPLSLLIKHVAFKEEQECRIIKFIDLTEAKETEIHIGYKNYSDFDTMYINYKPSIKESIDKIFFAPKAEGLELFKNFILHKKLGIRCQRSDHPYFIKP